MKLWPNYPSRWGRLWDMVAGLITAFLVNAVLLLLSGQGLSGYLFSLLPWAINGLFLLVFLLILPWFALGYVTAAVITLLLAIIASLMLLTGRLLPIGVAAAVEQVSALLAALGQSDAPLGELPPDLTRFTSAVDRAAHIPTTEAVGYLLLIFVSLLIMIFLLQSIDRK